jgi:aminoglycoside 2''-phosphotransferase
LQLVKVAYPDLAIWSAEPGGGQNSDLLLINSGTLVFRFPRYEHVLECMRIEAAVLVALQGRLPLPVPRPLFIQLRAPLGEAFLGYRSLPGEPLAREALGAVRRRETMERLAGQLGSFLQALHSVPYRETIPAWLPERETYADAAALYDRLREKVSPLLAPRARDRLADHFETYLGQPANFAFTPVLRHGDFGASNILFDRQAGHVTGIIDFTEAAAGDPAYDIAGLAACYGEGFVRICARSYPAIRGLWQRIRHYAGRFALEEALFGVENGDEQAVRAGLAGYQPEGT